MHNAEPKAWCRFTHGRPDVQLLRDYCHKKFGWPQDKAEELLQPVLKVWPASVRLAGALQ